MANIPPQSENVQNLNEFPVIGIEEYSVCEWHPQPDGKGKPTQVHLMFKIKGLPHQFSLRLKTPEVCDQLIAMLQRHRKQVWGRR